MSSSSSAGSSSSSTVRVRALASDASQAAKKAYVWPVANEVGDEFILFQDGLDDTLHTAANFEVRMKVASLEGSVQILECLDPECPNPTFGTKTTSGSYHAAKHLRTYHLKLLREVPPKKKQKAPSLVQGQSFLSFGRSDGGGRGGGGRGGRASRPLPWPLGFGGRGGRGGAFRLLGQRGGGR
jgi:hypothetical protein